MSLNDQKLVFFLLIHQLDMKIQYHLTVYLINPTLQEVRHLQKKTSVIFVLLFCHKLGFL